MALAYIFPKKEFDETSEMPAKLYLKWNEAVPAVLDAKVRNWNENYGGVVVSGRDAELLSAIEGIRDAKGKIQAGIEVLGNKESAAFSSKGSKKAMTTVIEKCKLK